MMATPRERLRYIVGTRRLPDAAPAHLPSRKEQHRADS